MLDHDAIKMHRLPNHLIVNRDLEPPIKRSHTIPEARTFLPALYFLAFGSLQLWLVWQASFTACAVSVISKQNDWQTERTVGWQRWHWTLFSTLSGLRLTLGMGSPKVAYFSFWCFWVDNLKVLFFFPVLINPFTLINFNKTFFLHKILLYLNLTLIWTMDSTQFSPQSHELYF